MPTSDFDALDQFVALSKCLAGLPVQDSYGQTAYPKLKSRITATMDALLNQINKENDFALPDSTGNSGPCRCAAHPEPNVHGGTTLDDLSDDARAELISSFNKAYGIKSKVSSDPCPDDYADLTKARTLLMHWLQNTIKKNHWEKVMIEVNASILALPWIYPSKYTNADDARDINTLHHVFGLEPATAANDLTNDAVETREGVDVKVTPKLKADLTKACTTLVSWVQELCRQYGWQEVKIDIRPEGPVCPLIFPQAKSVDAKAALVAADALRSIFGIEV